MRTLCPNLVRENGLDTVLEIPIPEEVTASTNHKSWSTKLKTWMTRPHTEDAATSVLGGCTAQIQFLLGVIGAPVIPIPIWSCDRTAVKDINKGQPSVRSKALYIVQQYVAAAGGEHALNSIESMYAMGKVKMAALELMSDSSKGFKMKNMKHRGGEMVGFVLWRKSPDLWSLELMVCGFKMSAGSDGKVAWRQTPWQPSHAPRGPPCPLRRSLQGLDPRSTADLFSNSICIGEKTINDEDCFILKLEADPPILSARSSTNVEIIRHTVCGCFSQKTGLLLQLEDSHLLKIKDVLWETTMESLIKDYRTVEGVNIAHSGRTTVSLFRFSENSDSHMRKRIEEIWSIEEVDFNIKGLSTDCFLPPADLKREDVGCGAIAYEILSNSSRMVREKSAKKVVAVAC